MSAERTRKGLRADPARSSSNFGGTAKDKRRGATNERLRNERRKADQAVVRKRTKAEKDADSIVQLARVRADTVLRTARDRAEHRVPTSGAMRERGGRRRDREDRALARQRASADAVLHREREAQKRYLRDFFEVERVATDKSLAREGAQADRAAASKERFLEAISHDLRSLLMVLTLNFQLLESVVV